MSKPHQLLGHSHVPEKSTHLTNTFSGAPISRGPFQWRSKSKPNIMKTLHKKWGGGTLPLIEYRPLLLAAREARSQVAHDRNFVPLSLARLDQRDQPEHKQDQPNRQPDQHEHPPQDVEADHSQHAEDDADADSHDRQRDALPRMEAHEPVTVVRLHH